MWPKTKTDSKKLHWHENLYRFWDSGVAACSLGWLGYCWKILAVRRRRRLQAQACKLARTVVVAGNITPGGTGKTPLVNRLATLLKEAGYRPGIVSRGYGGNSNNPQLVSQEMNAEQVGDEPLLLARRWPVSTGRDRVAAAQLLIDAGCDIIISDDGLQHYRLARDIEMIVIDGQRGLGNGRCLPAGPLREPPERLAEADYTVINGSHSQLEVMTPNALTMSVQPVGWRKLNDTETVPGKSPGTGTVHAVCGIGNPRRFFDTLQTLGLKIIPHSFADHHRFKPAELLFDDQLPVVMTAKDAVKCAGKIPDQHAPRYWVLEVEAQLSADFEQDFLDRVRALCPPEQTA